MKDVMLDLETLGTRHDAMIISIGACYFDRNTGEIGEVFSRNVNPFSLKDKFTVDYETIAWWFSQSEDARYLAMQDPQPLSVTLMELREFLNKPDIFLWSHATFDMPILTHALDVCGIKNPVPFRNMRDVRTIMDVSGHHSKTERTGTHHQALSDAGFQAKYVFEAFYKLNQAKDFADAFNKLNEKN